MKALMADSVYGVYEVDGFIGDYVNQDGDFYFALKTLGDDTIIAAWVSEEIFAKIDAEYGIKKL